MKHFLKEILFSQIRRFRPLGFHSGNAHVKSKFAYQEEFTIIKTKKVRQKKIRE